MLIEMYCKECEEIVTVNTDLNSGCPMCQGGDDNMEDLDD